MRIFADSRTTIHVEHDEERDCYCLSDGEGLFRLMSFREICLLSEILEHVIVRHNEQICLVKVPKLSHKMTVTVTAKDGNS